MSGSKPRLKVRTLDEMFKKISESSENDPEQLAHTSEKNLNNIFLFYHGNNTKIEVVNIFLLNMRTFD
jgi:hypothetical protein